MGSQQPVFFRGTRFDNLFGDAEYRLYVDKAGKISKDDNAVA
jgi:hypothetical protein